MSHAQLLKRPEPYSGTWQQSSATQSLSAFVYRSRAARPFSYPELQQLMRDAQSRNHEESLTGLMVYDEPYFYQWLEGPPDSVGRVRQSIKKDPRHQEIEVLRETPISARMFNGWDMKLATRAPQGGLWQRDVIYPSLTTITALRRDPNAAPDLMAKLAVGAAGRADGATQTGVILKDLIRSQILPELAVRHGFAPVIPAVLIDARVAELTELLLATDAEAALELIHEQAGQGASAVPLYASLLEPAARRLGDMLKDEGNNGLDLTIALSRLQSAVRLLGVESLNPFGHHHGGAEPSVLVVPLPGEIHGLGAALDSEAMWQEGWSPQSEFPVSDEALQKIVKGHWFDVLDLSLSVSLRREHWLQRMATTIEMARRASMNPALIILAGGRVFAEDGATADTVGADGANKTASTIVEDILQGMGTPHER
jgi:methanogenic corrinoid protein MtbC1